MIGVIFRVFMGIFHLLAGAVSPKVGRFLTSSGIKSRSCGRRQSLVCGLDGGDHNMIYIISGVTLMAISSVSFWYLLPRNGEENPLVRNSNVGSSLTIAILSAFTFGLVLLFGSFF